MRPLTGEPVYTLNAIWRETGNGYDVEFRFPMEWLNEDQQLMISVADVNSHTERRIDTVVTTITSDNAGALNKLIIRSPELDRIIRTGICRCQCMHRRSIPTGTRGAGQQCRA